MMLVVVVAVAVFALLVGVGLFAGYQVGYGDGYEVAMAENREEHYLTD